MQSLTDTTYNIIYSAIDNYVACTRLYRRTGTAYTLQVECFKLCPSLSDDIYLTNK